MKINNINQYSDLELALMCLLGYLGNGAVRKNKLKDRFMSVQNLVNHIVDNDEMPKSNTLTFDDFEKAMLSIEPSHSDYINYINEVIDLIKEDMRNEIK